MNSILKSSFVLSSYKFVIYSLFLNKLGLNQEKLWLICSLKCQDYIFEPAYF